MSVASNSRNDARGMFLRVLAVAAPALVGSVLALRYSEGLEVAFLSLAPLAAILRERTGRTARPETFTMVVAVCVLFAAFYAWIIEPAHGTIVSDSDPALYDAIARAVADQPLLSHLNPIDFGYIRQAAAQEGIVLSNVGYFKMLGAVYGVASRLNLEGAWLAVVINMWALSVIGSIITRACGHLGVKRRARYAVALVFMSHPTVAGTAFSVRKDIVILLLMAMAMMEIVFGESRRTRLGAVGLLLLPLRAPAAIMIAVWWLCQQALAHVPKTVRECNGCALLGAMTTLLAIQLYGLAFGSRLFAVTADSVHYDLLRADTSGLAGTLLASAPGRVAYSLLYPFPSSRWPSDAAAAYQWVFYAGGVCLIAMIAIALPMGLGKSCRALKGVLCGWFVNALLVGSIVQAAAAVDQVGIVEPRYQLVSLFCVAIVGAYMMHSRPFISATVGGGRPLGR